MEFFSKPEVSGVVLEKRTERNHSVRARGFSVGEEVNINLYPLSHLFAGPCVACKQISVKFGASL